VRVPEKILKIESFPAYGSAIVLKTGRRTARWRRWALLGDLLFGLIPRSPPVGGIGKGEVDEVEHGWIAMLRDAEP